MKGKCGIWATPYVLSNIEAKFISALGVLATCKHHCYSLPSFCTLLFIFSGLGTLALNPDQAITLTLKYYNHVCLNYICVCIRKDKEGRLIKDNANHFQPLRGEKTILSRSKRPFFNLKWNFHSITRQRRTRILYFKAPIKILYIHSSPKLPIIVSTC